MLTDWTECWGESCPPTWEHVPKMDATLIDECADVCETGGLHLLDWQRSVLAPWLSVTPAGKWVASVCGNEVPRQNGKSLMVCARIVYGMLKRWPILGDRGERVIYTAHLQKTATETFEAIASWCDASPAAHKRLKQVKTALGREEIVLNNGGRVKFLARTRASGRGQHGDLLVLDEALELSATAQASLLPAVSASRNPQSIYTSSPPTPESECEVYEGLRTKAHTTEPARMVWHEWSIDGMPQGASDDELVSLAWTVNPSLGVLISEDTVRGEVEQMSLGDYARERLGWWAPRSVLATAVDRVGWSRTASDKPITTGTVGLGVKFAPDGSRVCVAAARHSDAGDWIELVHDEGMARGTGWLADWLADRRRTAACVLIDGRAGSGDLAARLMELCGRAGERGGYVRLASTRDVTAAAAALVNGIAEGGVHHWTDKGQAALDASAATTVKRKVGDGYGFDGLDATPLEAASLALHAARTTRRDPGRRGGAA